MERAFLAREPYFVTVEYHRKGREYALRFDVRERPPIELSLLLGEFVHQARATLDNAVCAIADKHGAAKERTAMPVCLKADDWAKRGTQNRIAAVPQAARAAIQELQPYNARDDFFARHHRLYLLDELWNADKHRTLILTLGTSMSLHMDFSRPVIFLSTDVKGYDRDSDIFRVVPNGWIARGPSDLKYNHRLAFRVGFGAGGPYQSGIVVASAMSRLFQFVRSEAIPKLRPFM
jgi:hypothetical protein